MRHASRLLSFHRRCSAYFLAYISHPGHLLSTAYCRQSQCLYRRRNSTCPVPRAPVLVQVLESGQVLHYGLRKSTCQYSKHGCSLAPTSAALHSPGKQRSHIRTSQLHQEVQRLSRRVETELRRCPTGYDESRVQSDMSGNASKSNLRGYAAAGLEASLHNLLTSARLTRVLTHCTWEKTTVAISKCGSKVGRYASSVCIAVPELHGEAVRGRVLVRRGFFSDGVLFSVHGYNSIILT